MALSAEFSVNGSSAIQAHSVAYGATVSLAALSLSFRTIAWEISSSSKTGATAPTITLSGSPTGATASFTQVADPLDDFGRAWVVKCTQTDSQGNAQVSYRVVGTLNSQSRMPICADEGKYRDATHGWSQVINEALAASAGGGGGGWTDDGAIVRLSSSSDSVAIGTASLSGTEKLRVIGNSRFEQAVAATGNPKAFYVSGAAHTALTPGAEVIDFDLALDRIVEHGTGAVATQRAAVLRSPTYSFVGASTITDAATLAITAAPTAGTNATITNAYALWVQAGAVRIGSLGAGVMFTTSTGVVSRLAYGTGSQYLRMNSGATALEFANLALSDLGAIAALSVIANATNASAVPTAVVGTTDQVFRVDGAGTGLGFGSIDLSKAATVGSSLLAFANIANGSARSVLGRAANSSGVQASIAGAGANTVLVDNGTTIGFAAVPVAALANGTACSVIGRSANSTGAYADISIGTNDHVLMRTSNAVTSGFVANANVSASAAIAGTKISPDFGSQNVITTGLGTFAGLSLTAAGLTYASSVVTPVISQAVDSTATVTGDLFTFNAQDCSGTTAVTAGALAIRAGNATGGSGTRNGGAASLASGTGATTDGNLTLLRGATTVFSATSTATGVGNSTIIIEGASLSSRKVVALGRGSAVSATQVPSGDGLVYIAAATTVPSSNPVSGVVVYVDSSGNTWIRGTAGTLTMIAPA